MRSQKTRVIGGRVNSNGTTVGDSSEFSVRRVGAGDYYISFAPYLRLLGYSSVSSNGSAMFSAPVSNTQNFIRQIIYNSGSVASDQAFSFSAVVSA
jgi:hypothetical protein